MYAKYSDNWFLDLYFKYGSVEEAMKSSEEYMPISHATYHRKVSAAKLVGSAGRHVSLPEVLHFFRVKAMEPGTPIEKVYKKMPNQFKTSLVTLHRIYNSIEKQLIRREATVILISHPDDKYKILVGRELKQNLRYDKKVGDISVPTGFSKKAESSRLSILRVLQEEFSTKLAIEGKLEKHFDIDNKSPFMHFDIIDVRVKVFHLVCPEGLLDLKECSSYKLTGHRFANISDLENNKNDLRTGAIEIINGYKCYLHGESDVYLTSKLNSLIINKAPNQKLALHYQI